MNILFFTLILLGTMNAFADIELITRYNPEGSYSKGAYSFYFETQDGNITKNNYDIQFEDRSDFKGYFDTRMVVDQIGRIVDLGKIDCTSLKNDGSYDRQKQPYRWLYRSDMFDKLSSAKERTEVFEGHCYLLDRINSYQRVLALFRVKEYVKNRSVILDQIEVMGRFELNQKLD